MKPPSRVGADGSRRGPKYPDKSQTFMIPDNGVAAARCSAMPVKPGRKHQKAVAPLRLCS